MTIERPMFPPRRKFLLQAAGVAAGSAALGMALPLPEPAQAAVAGPDPIFAAIERHRAAYATYDAALGEDELEAYIPRERRRSSFYDALEGDPGWRVPTDHPDWIAHIEQSAKASIGEAEAACALVSTEGLTPAGAIALINYAKERSEDRDFWQDLEEDGEPRSWHYLMLRQVSEALAVLS